MVKIQKHVICTLEIPGQFEQGNIYPLNNGKTDICAYSFLSEKWVPINTQKMSLLNQHFTKHFRELTKEDYIHLLIPILKSLGYENIAFCKKKNEEFIFEDNEKNEIGVYFLQNQLVVTNNKQKVMLSIKERL